MGAFFRSWIYIISQPITIAHPAAASPTAPLAKTAATLMLGRTADFKQ